MMERLSIEEVIEHCNRHTKYAECMSSRMQLEETPIGNSDYMKQYWEHRQVAEWLEELKEYRKHIKLTEIPKQYKLGFQDGIVNGFENGYNNAIDDFYNALANDLIWIKERFGDDVYTDLWCDVGTRAEQLKAGGENGKLSF